MLAWDDLITPKTRSSGCDQEMTPASCPARLLQHLLSTTEETTIYTQVKLCIHILPGSGHYFRDCTSPIALRCGCQKQMCRSKPTAGYSLPNQAYVRRKGSPQPRPPQRDTWAQRPYSLPKDTLPFRYYGTSCRIFNSYRGSCWARSKMPRSASSLRPKVLIA